MFNRFTSAVSNLSSRVAKGFSDFRDWLGNTDQRWDKPSGVSKFFGGILGGIGGMFGGAATGVAQGFVAGVLGYFGSATAFLFSGDVGGFLLGIAMFAAAPLCLVSGMVVGGMSAICGALQGGWNGMLDGAENGMWANGFGFRQLAKSFFTNTVGPTLKWSARLIGYEAKGNYADNYGKIKPLYKKDDVRQSAPERNPPEKIELKEQKQTQQTQSQAVSQHPQHQVHQIHYIHLPQPPQGSPSAQRSSGLSGLPRAAMASESELGEPAYGSSSSSNPTAPLPTGPKKGYSALPPGALARDSDLEEPSYGSARTTSTSFQSQPQTAASHDIKAHRDPSPKPQQQSTDGASHSQHRRKH